MGNIGPSRQRYEVLPQPASTVDDELRTLIAQAHKGTNSGTDSGTAERRSPTRPTEPSSGRDNQPGRA